MREQHTEIITQMQMALSLFEHQTEPGNNEMNRLISLLNEGLEEFKH